MPAGFYVHGDCVPALDSTDVYFSSLDSVLVAATSSTHHYKVFAKVNGIWSLEEYTIASSGATSLNFRSPMPTPTLASCTYDGALTNTERFLDGNVLGWGVALAMVGAWAIHAMRRGL